MTKREVVGAVLDHRTPPYVPWSFGFTVEVSPDPLTPERLAGFDILWLSDSQDDWTAVEIDAVAEWVLFGGSLYLQGEWVSSISAFNLLLDELDAATLPVLVTHEQTVVRTYRMSSSGGGDSWGWGCAGGMRAEPAGRASQKKAGRLAPALACGALSPLPSQAIAAIRVTRPSTCYQHADSSQQGQHRASSGDLVEREDQPK